MAQLILNTRHVDLPAAEDGSLLDFLRNAHGLTAAKPACGSGDCSACLVLVGEIAAGDRQPHYRALASCLLTTGQVAGCHVITPEGLNGAGLTPVQAALVEQGGMQCGFCSPGLVVALTGALLNGESLPDAAGGNLCRCTGYAGIRRAMAALEQGRPGRPLALVEAVAAGLLPAGLAEAAGRLQPLPGEALHLPNRETVIAGDTDWSVQHPHRVGGQHALLQLHRQPALRQIVASDTAVNIGAAVTVHEFQHHPAIAADWPGLPDFLNHFASPAVRNSATLGGNLVNASPVADMAVILLALGAELLIAGPTGERALPLADFYLGFHQTGLQAHELLTAIRIPRRADGWRLHTDKVARREHDDVATVNSALLAGPGEAGHFGSLRLSAGGVGPFPVVLTQASAFLSGQPLTVAAVRRAVRVAGGEVSPGSGLRGSGDYKRRLLQHLLVGHVCALYPEIPFAECLP